MLKQIIRGLVVGSLTFAIGVTAASLWNAPAGTGLSVSSIWHGRKTTSLCDIEANPTPYLGKTIRFRAFVERGKVITTAMSFCASEETASAILEIDPNIPTGFPWPASRATSSSEDDEIFFADAVVVGQLDPSVGPGCFGPEFNVREARIEKILSTKEFDNRHEAVEWVKSNSD